MFYSMSKLIKSLHKPKYSNKCIQASKSRRNKEKYNEKKTIDVDHLAIEKLKKKEHKSHKHAKEHAHEKRKERKGKYSHTTDKYVNETTEASNHEGGDTKNINSKNPALSELSSAIAARNHHYKNRHSDNKIDDKEIERFKLKQQILRFHNVKRLLKLERQLEQVLKKLDEINSQKNNCPMIELNHVGTQCSVRCSEPATKETIGSELPKIPVKNSSVNIKKPVSDSSNKKILSYSIQSTRDELQQHLNELKSKLRESHISPSAIFKFTFCKKCYMSRANCICPPHKIKQLEGIVPKEFLQNRKKSKKTCTESKVLKTKSTSNSSKTKMQPLLDLRKHKKNRAEKDKNSVNASIKTIRSIKSDKHNKRIDLSKANQVIEGVVHFQSKTRVDFRIGSFEKIDKKKARHNAKYYKKFINLISTKPINVKPPPVNLETPEKNTSSLGKEKELLKSSIVNKNKKNHIDTDTKQSREVKDSNKSTPCRDKKEIHKVKKNNICSSQIKKQAEHKRTSFIFQDIDDFERRKLGVRQTKSKYQGSIYDKASSDYANLRCNTLITINK